MKKFLVIQLSRMGDIIFTLPLLSALKEDHPGCRVTVVSYRDFNRIILPSKLIDRHVQISFGDIEKVADWAEAGEVAENGFPELSETFDAVINLAYGDAPAKLCSAVDAPVKYGRVAAQQNEVRLQGSWMKYLFSAIQHRRHNLLGMQDIFTRVGDVKNRRASGFLPVEDENKQAANVEKLLNENGFKGNGKLVALQLGASESVRTWELEKFVETGKQLLQHPDHGKKIEIVLTGSPDEVKKGEQFETLCNFPVINLIGKTEIPDLPVLLEKCDLLISSDTGPVHIAAARGTQVLGIYFASAYAAETGPYGENHMVLQSEIECNPCNTPEKCKDPKCRNAITPGTAAKVALHMLFPAEAESSKIDSKDFSLYCSQFLDNGTLIYCPVMSDNIPYRYQKGLLGRIFWEPGTELEIYTDFMDRHLPQLKGNQQFAQMLIDYRAELQNLTIIFAHAIQWCHVLIKEFSNPPVNTENVNKMVGQLTQVEQVMDKREEPLVLFKHYFSFEIMDMDYLQFPALAVEMGKKYSFFLDWVQENTKKVNALISHFNAS